jgi:hypothetical protein
MGLESIHPEVKKKDTQVDRQHQKKTRQVKEIVGHQNTHNEEKKKKSPLPSSSCSASHCSIAILCLLRVCSCGVYLEGK